MEGIIVWNGKGEGEYIRAWFKFDRKEGYIDDFDLIEVDGLPFASDIFDVASPKLLIQR